MSNVLSHIAFILRNRTMRNFPSQLRGSNFQFWERILNQVHAFLERTTL